MTGDEITKESQNDIENDLSFFNTFMLIFAVVALLVGSFIIFNTFSITVAQRTRENALLRAIGASKRQVLRSVLIEAVIVALVASLIGLVAGLAVAAGLKALLAGLGFDIPAGSLVVTPRTVVISLVVGVVITVVAALSPARKAGKVPPVAAMRDVEVGSTGYGSKLRIVVGWRRARARRPVAAGRALQRRVRRAAPRRPGCPVGLLRRGHTRAHRRPAAQPDDRRHCSPGFGASPGPSPGRTPCATRNGPPRPPRP